MDLFDDRADSSDGVTSTVTLPIFTDHRKGEIVLVMDYSSLDDGNRRRPAEIQDHARRGGRSCRESFAGRHQHRRQIRPGALLASQFASPCPNNISTIRPGTTNMTSCIEDRHSPYNLESSTPNTSTKKNSTKFYTASCTTSRPMRLNVRPLTVIACRHDQPNRRHGSLWQHAYRAWT